MASQIIETINIRIDGNTPSKKNSKQIVFNRKTGKNFIISSKNYATWHKEALKQLKMTYTGTLGIERTICVSLGFVGKDRRLFDLSNRAESVMDLLVDAGILKDDNYSVVPKLNLHYIGVSKDSPCCLVTIEL